MWRFERSREEHDAPRVLRDSLQCTSHGGGRRHPDQKHRIDIFQAAIERLWNREIPAHHIDLWRHTGRVRVADHGAETRPRCRQLIDNVATNVAGAADDKDAIHVSALGQEAIYDIATRFATDRIGHPGVESLVTR